MVFSSRVQGKRPHFARLHGSMGGPKEGGKTKGGGSKVQTTAPKPVKRLTAAEMEANWEALT